MEKVKTEANNRACKAMSNAQTEAAMAFVAFNSVQSEEAKAFFEAFQVAMNAFNAWQYSESVSRQRNEENTIVYNCSAPR